jgi:pyruvate kinase
MLSEETAMGKHPVDAVSAMAKISEYAQQSLFTGERESMVEGYEEGGITPAVCHAAYTTAKDISAAAIITPTSSGTTPRLVSRYRPRQPIIALSPNLDTVRQLPITFGVIPRLVIFKKNLDDVIETAKAEALTTGLVRVGDAVVITAGSPGGVKGTTNLIRVEVL